MSPITRRVQAGPAPGLVEVWRVPLDPEGRVTSAQLAHLDPDESARAERMGSRGGPWAEARVALRHILGSHIGREPKNVPLVFGHEGAPGLVAPWTLHFSHSHTDRCAVVALSSDRPLGVDVERIYDGVDLDAVGEMFLPPAELAAVRMCPPENRRHAFFVAWTRHEARLKLRGEALAEHPSDRVAEPSPLVLIRSLALGEDLVGAVAAEGGSWRIVTRDYPDLLAN
jgi:4'-phosphopantetheinyl transferase